MPSPSHLGTLTLTVPEMCCPPLGLSNVYYVFWVLVSISQESFPKCPEQEGFFEVYPQNTWEFITFVTQINLDQKLCVNTHAPPHTHTHTHTFTLFPPGSVESALQSVNDTLYRSPNCLDILGTKTQASPWKFQSWILLKTPLPSLLGSSCLLKMRAFCMQQPQLEHSPRW